MIAWDLQAKGRVFQISKTPEGQNKISQQNQTSIFIRIESPVVLIFVTAGGVERGGHQITSC